jgi:hypothetical protein
MVLRSPLCNLDRPASAPHPQLHPQQHSRSSQAHLTHATPIQSTKFEFRPFFSAPLHCTHEMPGKVPAPPQPARAVQLPNHKSTYTRCHLFTASFIVLSSSRHQVHTPNSSFLLQLRREYLEAMVIDPFRHAAPAPPYPSPFICSFDARSAFERCARERVTWNASVI